MAKAIFVCFVLCLVEACKQPVNKIEEEIEPPKIGSSTEIYVEVLGIAQDAGYPQIDCKRNCCSALLSKGSVGARVVSLALVDERDSSAWMFEATPDIRSQWTRLTDLSSGKVPKGVFLTHAHIGHYSGLMQFGRESMGAQGIPVYAMPGMVEFLQSNGPWKQLVDLKNINLSVMQELQDVDLKSDLSVMPIIVPHRDEYSETVGYMIVSGMKSLLFIPDIDKWERWDVPVEVLLDKVDYALVDGTFFQAGELPGRDMAEIPHPFIEESMARFSKLEPRLRSKIYFIHFNHTNPVLWDSAAVKQVQHAGFNIAHEGMRLILSD